MFQDIIERTFFQNRVFDYLIFILILLIGILIVRVIRHVILKRLMDLAKKTTTTIYEFLIELFKNTVIPILYFGLFYFSIRTLALNPILSKTIDVLGMIVLTVSGIRFLGALVKYALKNYWLKKKEDETREHSVKALMPIIRVIIWGIGAAFLLDNLGVKISAVIAALGIGGLAVALAAQAVLGDLFSYLSILFDHPFEIGDFIIVGDYLGVVEHIGIKTTRIRSLGGEQLVFSNTDLTNSRVRNYKRMQKRRVVFKIGVTYETSLDRLKEIPVMITNAIKDVDDTVFDRAHFSSYGDFSLVFEVVYYVLSSNYNKYMDIQEKINFAIKSEFEKRGIEFAYPTQTLYLSKT